MKNRLISLTNQGIILIALFCLSITMNAQGQNKSWTQKPLNQWEQIALINNVKFNDAKSNNPYAGSAFLLDTGKEIVAVTAKHVLFFAKSKQMNSVHFRGTLKEWAFHPKGDSSQLIVAERLLNADINEKLDPAKLMAKDCIVFTLKKKPSHIKTLKLRQTPISANETVYAVGYPYVDKNGGQNVYKGKFLRKSGANLLIKLEDSKLNLRGMSGGAVIDKNGELVGIVSRTMRDPQTKEILFAPVTTDYLKQVLKQNQKI